MKYYTVAEIALTDPAWVVDYTKAVTALVEGAGGRFLARTGQFETLEGNRHPEFWTLIEWPSKATADAFYISEAYAPYRRARIAGSHTEMFLIAGEDITGAATLPRS